jgi:uncharacterized protein (DUF697 family)
VARGKQIIRHYSNWAVIGGFLPIPIIDLLAIAAIQLGMLRDLSRHYGVPFERNLAKSLVTTLLGSVFPCVAGFGLVRSIGKIVPVLGWGVGLAAISVLARAATHAIGGVFLQHFESGGTLLDFDPIATRDFFRREFKKTKHRMSDASATGSAKGEP